MPWTLFTNCTSFSPNCTEFRTISKRSQMHPNTTKLTKKEFIVQWAGPGALVAQLSDTTSWHVLFSVMAPVQPKLHRFSQSNEMIPNAPKHYKTHQNMSLGSNGVDQVHSLWKCLTWLHGTNFFHLLHQFSPNCTEFRKVTKQSKMHSNTTKLTKTWV